jgi:hypothetical protein
VRSHVKASFAAPIQASGHRQVRTGLTCLMVLGLVAFLGIGAPSASAVDTCPNVVFRTGPSSKLPECRAYELVTPTYTGGQPPTYEGFLSDLPGMFATDTVTAAGDSVVYHSVGGGLSGFSATGKVDRYRAKRTAQGWRTEPISPGGDEMTEGGVGGVSPDHEYSVNSAIEVTAKLWPAFAGKIYADMLRTPSGYEPLGRGSLGDSELARADWISAKPTHVIFSTETKLEPNAPASGTEAVYDRTPGGPTHVVSLLPGDVTPSAPAEYLGTTKDGAEVAFTTGSVGQPGLDGPLYARRNNTVTEEVVRPGGVVVGKELTCTGEPGSATLAYQWLRNGTAIGGASSPTYTTTAADEGGVVQCRVSASNGEGATVATSPTRLVEPYQGTTPPETSEAANVNGGITSAEVGTLLTCGNANFRGSPTLAYQWLRDGTEVGGATASTYTPVEADVGGSLQCRITATNAAGTALAYSANPVSIYNPVPTTTDDPEIFNVSDPDSTPQVGDQLFCAHKAWTQSPSFTYGWLRNGAAIGGATSATYITSAADEEKTIQCRVTATTSGGSTEATSEQVVVDPQPGTAPPKQTFPGGVFGTAKGGNTLFCGAGGWEGEPSFTFQWLRNGTPIGGATSSSYALTAADLETVIQCRLTATNGGGATVAINANEGAKAITRAAPEARARLPQAGFTFDGIFNGRVFYTDAYTDPFHQFTSSFGNLYMYDLNTEKTTTIANTGDASIVNVSEDGSHVYFVSKSLIDGEGEVGKPNLGVWDAVSESVKFIATMSEEDVTSGGGNQTASINAWAPALSPHIGFDRGRAMDHTRSTPDGNVFAFESTAQLTSFDNTEASEEDCGDTTGGQPPTPGQACDEVYRYDATNEELTCVSCGPGSGPATGNARLQTLNFNAGLAEVEPATPNSPVESLTADGNTVFFESTEGLVPQDGNETKDVYRWTKGAGVALISTGQDVGESALYGVTPSGSDVIFATRQQLLPEDENGSTVRLYDARVDGGFPPPEETVTEPCAGDACQGATGAAPETPNVASSSLSGGGNVAAKLKCAKHSRRVVRKGAERCLRKHRHGRAHHKRRTAR